MRTKPIMRNRLLRSVLVAAFSVGAALGVLGDLSGATVDTRADSTWPPIIAPAPAGDSVWAESPAHTDDSVWAQAPVHTDDSVWAAAPVHTDDSVWA